MTIKWTLVTRKLSDLKDYYKNPRSLSKKQHDHLNKSLEKFGLIDNDNSKRLRKLNGC